MKIVELLHQLLSRGITGKQRQQVASPPLEIFECLVHCIDHNGHLIVVHTKPGTAMTLAKLIDENKFKQIMGTVAGDDTIMNAPKNVSLAPILADHFKVYLSSIGIME